MKLSKRRSRDRIQVAPLPPSSFSFSPPRHLAHSDVDLSTSTSVTSGYYSDQDSSSSRSKEKRTILGASSVDLASSSTPAPIRQPLGTSTPAPSVDTSMPLTPPNLARVDSFLSQPSDSGDSSRPLVPRSSTEGQISHRHRDSFTPPKKLVKRRPGSIFQDHELDTFRLVPSGQSELRQPLPIPHPDDVAGATHVQSLPMSQSPPFTQQLGTTVPAPRFSLDRQGSSCSTAPSSDSNTPATEESDMVHTPQVTPLSLSAASPEVSWAGVVEMRPCLSRSSTRSFREGDDGSVVKDNRGQEGDLGAYIRSHAEGLNHRARRDSRNFPPRSSSQSSLRTDPTISSERTARRGSVLGLQSALTSPTTSRNASDNESPSIGQQPNRISFAQDGNRRSIVFETPVNFGDGDETIPRRRAKPTRPPLIRNRSSSLGAMSNATDSIYSIGEVNIATKSVFTAAKTVALASPYSPSASEDGPSVMETLQRMKNSSMSIRQAMESDPVLALATSTPSVTDRENESRNAFEDDMNSVRRRAPPPPRLTETFATRADKAMARRSLPTSPTVRQDTPAPPKSAVPQSSKNQEVIPKRPGMPERQSSFSRLWRKLSAPGSKRSKKVDGGGEGSVPTSPVKHVRPQIDTNIPPVPIPRKRSSKKGLSPIRSSPDDKLLHGGSLTRQGMMMIDLDIPEVPVRPARFNSKDKISSPSENKPIRFSPAIHSSPTIHSSPVVLSSPPTQPTRSTSLPVPIQPVTRVTNIRPIRKVTLPPSTSSENEIVDLLSPPESQIPTPDVSSDTDDAPDPLTGLAAQRNLNLTLSEELKKRRSELYRRTLFDIADDRVFQQVLEDLTRLEDVHHLQRGSSGLPTPQLSRTPSIDELANLSKQDGIKAWFVTRELVQGERRYGRLLAKGVTIVQAACGESALTYEYKPTRQSSSASSTSIPSPIQSPSTKSQMRRPRTSHSPSLISVPSPNPSLTVLADRLPRLLALSLTLSARFESDPSPAGVASAFSTMENELMEEMTMWAGEIGGLVVGGYALDGMGRHKRSASLSGNREGDGEGEEQEEKLRLSDIVISPIQRVGRYRLLFNDLSETSQPLSSPRSNTPPDLSIPDHPYETILAALQAAQRLAEACNKKQTFDLDALRRRDGKKKRQRPKSEFVRPSSGVSLAWLTEAT
ncbi:hypothetical protein M231_07864 [Tremella mesenterica]|uniref:DH domain-containing protein n=1 Tax=Tremella mesenterica TaxID=5217 RepID=A0A4Q1BDI0_TREME|nr:hypothetical protein M231_07864 [Tremella mesenterica]